MVGVRFRVYGYWSENVETQTSVNGLGFRV